MSPLAVRSLSGRNRRVSVGDIMSVSLISLIERGDYLSDNRKQNRYLVYRELEHLLLEQNTGIDLYDKIAACRLVMHKLAEAAVKKNGAEGL